jgi:hypothetical protein
VSRRTSHAAALALALASALALGGLAAPAAGHAIPAARSVVVQVEDRAAVLLVGYEPPVGEGLALLVGNAIARPADQTEAALRGLLVAGALGPLTVEVDGRAVALDHARSTVSLEPGRARPTVLALVEVPLDPGARRLSIAVSGGARRDTRVSWVTRGCRAVTAPPASPAHRFAPVTVPLVLDLQPPAPRTPCDVRP